MASREKEITQIKAESLKTVEEIVAVTSSKDRAQVLVNLAAWLDSCKKEAERESDVLSAIAAAQRRWKHRAEKGKETVEQVKWLRGFLTSLFTRVSTWLLRVACIVFVCTRAMACFIVFSFLSCIFDV